MKNDAIKVNGDAVMTVTEIGVYLRERAVPEMAFWQEVAGGDMHPMTLRDVRRFAREVMS